MPAYLKRIVTWCGLVRQYKTLIQDQDQDQDSGHQDRAKTRYKPSRPRPGPNNENTVSRLSRDETVSRNETVS